ncbi:phosphotransferase [Actinacidiphila oryziradicis]|uniref:Aminoglycoside phosphotransferase family protein n=1 Tax=Actinacidiphila oryziradicis TaxID=2571141 RepID=A0A4U0T745_9ACTN|nr:aminoglycoside phosphotransferase family protein [Actinacidiphila oryziradicis]TKA08835.1 aminoglycoside phosphotransferase family protein [Actinacidiphila oryziradicis]
MELIGSGRDADIYALDGSRVLRRYRHGGPTGQEARLMAHLADHGYPVPRVYDTTETDMVMDRLHGPTMVQALRRRPWRAYSYGRVLAGLHDSLHALAAPDWLPRRFSTGHDDRLLHLDLHPENVIVTANGPVVIDWRNAAAGDPAADTALTVVILRGAQPPGPLGRTILRALLRGFLTACRTDPAPRLADAVAARLADPNLLPAEAGRLRRMTTR